MIVVPVMMQGKISFKTKKVLRTDKVYAVMPVLLNTAKNTREQGTKGATRGAKGAEA